jgi:hypothetical protein
MSPVRTLLREIRDVIIDGLRITNYKRADQQVFGPLYASLYSRR